MKGAEEHEDSVHSRVHLSLAKDTVQIPWTATQKYGVNATACKTLYDLALPGAPCSLTTFPDYSPHPLPTPAPPVSSVSLPQLTHAHLWAPVPAIPSSWDVFP